MKYYLKNGVWFFAMGLLSTGCISLNGKSTAVARSSEQLYEEYEPSAVTGRWLGECYELSSDVLRELAQSGVQLPANTHVRLNVIIGDQKKFDLPYSLITSYYKNAQDCAARQVYPLVHFFQGGKISTQSFDESQGAWRAKIQSDGGGSVFFGSEYFDLANVPGVAYCGLSAAKYSPIVSFQLPAGKVCDPVNDFSTTAYPDLVGLRNDRLYFGLRESESMIAPTQLDLDVVYTRE